MRLRYRLALAACSASAGLVLSFLPMVYAVYFFLLSCDEMCYSAAPAGHWSGDPGAWQWDAQLVPALAGLTFTLYIPVCIARGMWSHAGLALPAALMSWGAWVILLAPVLL